MCDTQDDFGGISCVIVVDILYMFLVHFVLHNRLQIAIPSAILSSIF